MKARGRVVVPPPPAAPQPRSVSRGRRESHVDAAEAERSFGWPSTLRDGEADDAMLDRSKVRAGGSFAPFNAGGALTTFCLLARSALALDRRAPRA